MKQKNSIISSALTPNLTTSGKGQIINYCSKKINSKWYWSLRIIKQRVIKYFCSKCAKEPSVICSVNWQYDANPTSWKSNSNMSYNELDGPFCMICWLGWEINRNISNLNSMVLISSTEREWMLIQLKNNFTVHKTVCKINYVDKMK